MANAIDPKRWTGTAERPRARRGPALAQSCQRTRRESAPLCALSLTEGDRQWLKSRAGPCSESLASGTTPCSLARTSCNSVARDLATAKGVAMVAESDAHRREQMLLIDFATALKRPDQLRLVYQPRVDLASGRCVGVEALLRWRHPLLGEIAPGEIIPLIEGGPLIRPATAWVIDAAFRQLGEWRRQGLDLLLSINVSAANLTEPDFVQNIQLRLLQHRVRPQMLEIEITESAVMTDTGKALACLEALAAAWIAIAIDDFGAGYSSLAYLQRLPAQVVKIDQSFVQNLTMCEDREYVLVSTMIMLSHRLGYRVVAEGIETVEALDALTAMGCDEGQGYYFARPLEAADVRRWARLHQSGGESISAAS